MSETPKFPAIRVDPSVPPGEAHFVQDGRIVAKIVGLDESPAAPLSTLPELPTGKKFDMEKAYLRALYDHADACAEIAVLRSRVSSLERELEAVRSERETADG